MTMIGTLLALLAFLVGFIVRDFLPSYLRRKGENLATKEDIAEITTRQKAAEHKFNELIEQSKQRHALRTLVADKRIEAHQQAFLRVKRLLGARQDAAIISECRDWMDANCLYLTGGARKAVWDAIGFAEIRAYSLGEVEKAGGYRKVAGIYHDEALKAWSQLRDSLYPIVTEVELPALGDEELIAVTKGFEA